jgi:succinate-semialdehyde dehydrogenase/glutarate-semialdehyde dehydrogenase
MTLKDTSLLRSQAYIDGNWVSADSGQTYAVTNPATGETLAEVPRMGANETRRAIDAAAAALPGWRAKSAKERGAVLRKWGELMLENADDLAALMTLEQGKPLAEAKGEVGYAASFFEWFAEEAKRVYGDVIPSPTNDRRLVVIKQPIGVCAGITPWNFPSAMITRKVGPAIAAGCTFVIKPAEQTPLSAFALAELAERAGLPKGVFNIVIGDAEDAPAIGGELTSNPIVRKISFTGSTEVGKILLRQSADTVKKVSLELGGNAPFVVFDDADVDAAVEGAMLCKFRNTGQTCVCANRIYAQAGVYEEFTKKLAEKAGAMKVGSGFEADVAQGPLIDAQALEKVERHVADATARGAQIVTGGKRHALGGTFFEPTVLSGVTMDMAMAQEETFGPVAPVYKFEDDADVIRMANDTPYGLAAYFYSRDIGRIWRTAEALEYGIVGVNTGIISNEVAPFGGVKESGLGREGSMYGIDDFTEIKYIAMAGIDS